MKHTHTHIHTHFETHAHFKGTGVLFCLMALKYGVIEEACGITGHTGLCVWGGVCSHWKENNKNKVLLVLLSSAPQRCFGILTYQKGRFFYKMNFTIGDVLTFGD